MLCVLNFVVVCVCTHSRTAASCVDQVKKDVDFGRGDRLWGHGHPNHFARQMRPVCARVCVCACVCVDCVRALS